MAFEKIDNMKHYQNTAEFGFQILRSAAIIKYVYLITVAEFTIMAVYCVFRIHALLFDQMSKSSSKFKDTNKSFMYVYVYILLSREKII